MVPDHSPSTDERASLAQPSQFSSPLECTSHLGFSLASVAYWALVYRHLKHLLGSRLTRDAPEDQSLAHRRR